MNFPVYRNVKISYKKVVYVPRTPSEMYNTLAVLCEKGGSTKWA